MSEFPSPEDRLIFREAEYDYKVERAESGFESWLQRNTDTEHNGQVWDYVKNGVHHGFIDDEGDGNYRVYHVRGNECYAIGDEHDLVAAQRLLVDIVSFIEN